MSSLIVDLFTEFQTKMRTEMALLMTKVMEIQNLKGAEKPTVRDDTIIRSLEERLSLLEARLKVAEKPAASGSLTPHKRRLSEATQEVAAPVPAQSPITVQLEGVSQIIEPLSTMALETTDNSEQAVKEDSEADTDEEMTTESPTKRQRQETTEKEAAAEEEEVVEEVEEAEEEVEEEAEEEEVEEEAVEEEVEEQEEEAAEEEQEEEAAEEEQEEADGEAEELTEFMYKGKKYFMDSECQVYGLDADGELNDEPIGLYDEKTRRITFNA